MKRMISSDTAAAIVNVLGGDVRRWEKGGMIRHYMTPRAIEALGGGLVVDTTKAYIEVSPCPHIGTWDVQTPDALVASLETIARFATTPGPVPTDSRYTTAILAEQARRGLVPVEAPAAEAEV